MNRAKNYVNVIEKARLKGLLNESLWASGFVDNVLARLMDDAEPWPVVEQDAKDIIQSIGKTP